MTVVSNNDGQPVSWANKALGTSSTLIAAVADENRSFRLSSIIAACDGTPTTFSFWAEDGSANAYYIVNGDTVAANKSLQVTDHAFPLPKGWSFKCKAGTAGHLSVTAVLVQITGKRPDNAA
jgi:hypothetical protein